MALGVKDVVGLILYYIGGTKVGPSLGVSIGGTPAIHVDLFASIMGAIGNLFPATLFEVQFQISEALQSFGLSAETADAFVTNPMKTASNLFQTSVMDPLELALKQAGDVASKAAVDTLKSTVSGVENLIGQIQGTVAGVEWSDGLPNNLFPGGQTVFTVGDLSKVSESFTGNLTDINSCTKDLLYTAPSLSTAIVKDLSDTGARLVNAANETAKELVRREIETKANQYVNDFTTVTQTYQAKIYAATDTAAAKAKNYIGKAYAAAAPIVNVNKTIENKLAQASLPGYRSLAATFSSYTNLPVANKIVNIVDNAVANQQNTTLANITKLAANQAKEGVNSAAKIIPGVNLRIVS